MIIGNTMKNLRAIPSNVINSTKAAVKSEEAKQLSSVLSGFGKKILKDEAFVKVFAATTAVFVGYATFLPVQFCATLGAIFGVYHAVTGSK